LETVAKKLHTVLKLSEECKASLVEKLRRSEASKNTPLTSLQHKMELLQKKVANLETLLHTERELTSDYVTQETLQKQLELVTLRLPAPEIGFLGRILGGERKNEGRG
jgi:uncharacterized protein YlxW (UPF0749 family)